MDKCLETINILLSKEESKDHFFNNNDLNYILDICLNEIQREKNTDTRVQILKAIDNIVENKKFRERPYNMNGIQQVVKDLILEEEDNGGYSEKEKEWLSNLNLKFEMMKLK
jgi:hypothetical protein